MVIDGMHYNPNCSCKGCVQVTKNNKLADMKTNQQDTKSGWTDKKKYDSFSTPVFYDPQQDTKCKDEMHEHNIFNEGYCAMCSKKETWEEAFRKEFDMSDGRIDCYLFEPIDFIKDLIQKERESLIKEIVKLADEIECIPETPSFDVWRNWKYFRNTLRDKYLNTLK